jgi:hypothetical protein
MRPCVVVLLGFLLSSACATPAPTIRSPRLANLQRAAKLPWTDEGRCVVREAASPWSVVVEHCIQQLDHDRVRFRDTTGRCTVASTEAVTLGLGACVLAAPEIAVGAVLVLGAVVVGVAIKEALDAYEFRQLYPEETPKTRVAVQDAAPQRKPQPQPSGQDWLPPVTPTTRERPSRCEPIPVPHKGGDDDHNTCADRIPPNRYPGMDVLVDGKHFDALQVGARVLWEIKTDRFETYSTFLKQRAIQDQLVKLREERIIATACGYDFIVGVRSAQHKAALMELDDSFKIVVTECPQ